MADTSKADGAARQLTRSMRDDARAIRSRARRMLVDDGARRSRMREQIRRATRLTDRLPRSGSAPPPLLVRSEVVPPSGVLVVLSGEIDLATTPALVEALTVHVRSAAPGSDLRVDIGAVTFIDAQGVRALVEAGDAAATNDIRFRVVNQPSCLQRLVEIVGVEADAWR